MLTTIGLVAQSEREVWSNSMKKGQPKQIVEMPFHSDTAQTWVDAWLVVPQHTENPVRYTFWLRSLRAPIVLITQHLTAAFGMAQVIPFLTYVCHPFQAERDIDEFLYLAAYRSSGVDVIDVPHRWQLTTITTGGGI